MIARPKNCQIESKPTEIGASEVGRFSRCCCRPGYPHDPLDATRFVNPAYLRRRVRPGAASRCLHFCGVVPYIPRVVGAIVILHDRPHTPETLRRYFASSPPKIRLTTLTEACALEA